MALAAAWFESEPAADEDRDEYEAEGKALRWLESLADPELIVAKDTCERSDVEVFVPVNDKSDPSPMTLQSAPTLTRDRKGRTFPRMWVGDDPCFLRWENPRDMDEHVDALDRLCQKVTRIGHSSSLVSMWVSDESESDDKHEHLVPTESMADWQARTPSTGFLNLLIERFGEGPRLRHAELSERIKELKFEKKNTKGKGVKEVKAAIDLQIAEMESQLAEVVFRDPIRPTAGHWTGYGRQVEVRHTKTVHTGFDTDLLVLVAGKDNPRMSAASSLLATQLLRKAVIKHCPEPVPAWVNGHAAEGTPLQTQCGHMACIPLPFVGHEHADGHLLGLAIVFPRAVSRRERGEALGKLLVDKHRNTRLVELTLGRLGVWKLEKRDWRESRDALRPERWAAHPDGRRVWASVTPVVLDRFPKSDRLKERAAWTTEVASIVAQSCKNIGLPEPVKVDIDTTSWHRGSPRAIGKRRPLRGQTSLGGNDAALGDGFPFYPSKQGNSPRPQVHAWLEFDEEVIGPVLIGAGRYLGYGLCLPWEAKR
jgi:CRISPR-associated protein Csb2